MPAGESDGTATGPLAAVLARLFGDDADVVRDRTFQVLLLGSVVSPMGSSVVSPVLESLATPYGVPVARVGLLMAAFTAPSIVAIPLVGALSDRVGRKPVLAAGLALFAVAGGAASFTADFRVVVGLRLVQGIGYCGIGPVLIASVGDLYAGEREATAQGLRFATVGLSLALFPVVAGVLVTRGFQLPFLLFFLGLPVALVVLLVFEEPTRAGAGGGGGGRGGGTDGSEPEATVGALVERLRDPLVLAALVGRAVPSFVWFAFLTYASVVTGRLLGGSPGVAGLVVGLASLGSAVGGTQVGRLTATFDSRGLPLAATMAVCGAGLALFGLATSVPMAAAGAAFVGAGFGTVLTLYRSTVTGLADASARGGLVSVGESVGRVGSTAAPLVLGGLIAAGEPVLGFEAAVRYVLLGTAALGTVAGLGLGLLAGRAHTRATDDEGVFEAD
ncbi:MFS transporter [Haloglomus halophilum]|uniref:MFS transporter n=1 Tax=Haloglomus halophilum TaxID=2962672 RepID=UPI0020CA2463|nr:MFS transporter [Haloglomus halophilum]